MMNFWTITYMLAAWAVVVANSADHHPQAPLHPPAPAPGGPSLAPSVDCSSLIYKMSDCLQFLLVGGTDSKPEASCCSGFKVVVNTDANCICEGLKSSARMGFNIDMRKAKSLPSACHVKAPSLGTCKVSNAPGASPVNPPPPKSSPPHVPTPPPTATPPKPAAHLVPRVAPVPVGEAPAPSPASSGAYTMSSTFLVPLTMLVSAAYVIIF